MSVVAEPNTFTCAQCQGAFEKAWSDEEAIAEARALWGDDFADNVHVDTCASVICDDCHAQFMAWYDELKSTPP